jgi:hypothetical protein
MTASLTTFSHPEPPHDLQALKERLSVFEAWLRLGLPGRPARHCKSPFRPDRTPSFSIFAGGRRWKDFGTGEGGDVIDFIGAACGLAKGEAVRRFLGLVGVALPLREPGGRRDGLTGRAAKHDAAEGVRGPLALPTVHRGTAAELGAVARVRGLGPDAPGLADALGTLVFGEVCGFPCWILTDEARRVAEARRLDGLPFPPVGPLGERKAHTIRGSCKAWPVGVTALRRLPRVRSVMLVEGGPDYLAALHLSMMQDASALPVALLGRATGGRIDPQALALLAGRRVRIYPHADADGGGLTASEKWAAQLHAAGCEVDVATLCGRNGVDVKDLNDAVRLGGAALPAGGWLP